MTPAARRVAFNKEITGWAIRAAQDALSQGHGETAARWALVAARTAADVCPTDLRLPELERVLVSIAGSLPAFSTKPRAGHRRWLHVLTEAHGLGGHSAILLRWMSLGHGGDRHSLALTFQPHLTMTPLAEAVAAAGGTVSVLSGIDELTQRAARLRELSADADVVVLHLHPWDVVPIVAFGVAAGPPVLLVNHADHGFWLGASVADAVVNIRASGEDYARRYRGVRNHLRLPVPLEVPFRPTALEHERMRRDLRNELRVPQDAAVALTVGQRYKFTPVTGLDFLDTMTTFLSEEPSAYLVAVGPTPETPGWREAASTMDGRVIAVGRQSSLAAYHAAADLYLESFPFGSLTASLEAAATGLPVVRAPLFFPPPFVADGEAFASIEQPADVARHRAACRALLHDKPARELLGDTLAREVSTFHIGEKWLDTLASLRQRIPARHELPSLDDIEPLPTPLMESWAEFIARASKFSGAPEPVRYARSLAESLGLPAKADKRMAAALRDREGLAEIYFSGSIARLYPDPAATVARIGRRWVRKLRAGGST